MGVGSHKKKPKWCRSIVTALKFEESKGRNVGRKGGKRKRKKKNCGCTVNTNTILNCKYIMENDRSMLLHTESNTKKQRGNRRKIRK